MGIMCISLLGSWTNKCIEIHFHLSWASCKNKARTITDTPWHYRMSEWGYAFKNTSLQYNSVDCKFKSYYSERGTTLQAGRSWVQDPTRWIFKFT
jgi:hypothetical protein